ncbi:MAG: PHP domain-containing protein [bacterium]
MKADLHMHSVYSDGTKTVEELVLRAKEKGLTHIALTDHDSVNGVEEFIEHCNKHNIVGIKALELSTYYNNESVHILGYFLDEIPKSIIEYSKEQFVARHTRAKQYCENLEKFYGLKMDYNKIKDTKGMITRGSLAYLLTQDNDVTEDECRKYLDKDSKAYIEAAKLTTEDGIKLIKEANGIAVIAHPTLLKRTNVEDLIKLGLDGIEGYYPLNKENQHLEYIELAKKHNLMITAGSDYHGKIDKSHMDMATVYLEDNLFKRY